MVEPESLFSSDNAASESWLSGAPSEEATEDELEPQQAKRAKWHSKRGSSYRYEGASPSTPTKRQRLSRGSHITCKRSDVARGV